MDKNFIEKQKKENITIGNRVTFITEHLSKKHSIKETEQKEKNKDNLIDILKRGISKLNNKNKI